MLHYDETLIDTREEPTTPHFEDWNNEDFEEFFHNMECDFDKDLVIDFLEFFDWIPIEDFFGITNYLIEQFYATI